MASRTSGVPWRYRRLSSLLCSALLEWILMLLLLLEGLLSYLVTSFARLCKLRPPCPMCTRLDHVLGKAQPGFFSELMCSSHKAEASSWAFCRIHQKLAGVHSMCEACLLSFAADSKSNLEAYQSLMGKLGVGIENLGYRNNFSLRCGAREAPVMKKDTLCSCCSRSLKLKSRPFVVLQNEASGVGLDEVCRGVSRFHQHIDEVDYVAYSELKTSDSESEPWQLGGNLKEGVPLYDNPPGQSELILAAQNGGSYSRPSENTGEVCSIQTDGQQITEKDSNTRDKSENVAWHGALGSSKELAVTATTSAEKDTTKCKNKAEFTHTTSLKSSCNNVHEDLELLLSQLSNTSLAPGTDNPTVHDQSEQAKLHSISRALYFQRKDLCISESRVNEVEVEVECTIDHQLKRQIESDRQSISRLWKELEEERNASAVAANQTMAMITRLQEEKAAAQMEASQYRRMVEEQSEYDREKLQKTTETVQTLQAEIESYKVKLKDDQLHLDRRRNT